MRNAYFDNAKVFLILFVVLGHLIHINRGLFGEEVYWMIYSFHMPAFIFIAGYFSKKETWGVTLKKVIGLYLIPYVFFQELYNWLNYIWFDKNTLNDLFNPNFALWFLLAMVFWKIALQIVIRFKWMLVFFVLLVFTHHFWLDGLLEEANFLGVKRSISFCLFFFIGYFVKTNSHRFQQIKPTTLLHKFIGLFGITLVFFLYKQQILDIPAFWFKGNFLMNSVTEAYSTWSFIRYQIYVFFVSSVMVGLFLMLVPTGEYTWTKLGSATMSVYLLHPLVYRYIKEEDLSLAYDTIGDVLAVSTFSIAIVYILSQPIFARFVDFTTRFAQSSKKEQIKTHG